jgi:methylated-DNA-protein-cysteine methyltransferase-like protein
MRATLVVSRVESGNPQKSLPVGSNERMKSIALNEEIWQWVAAIPMGKVATYGQIARLAGYPNHARYVGTTMKNLPRDSSLPWFRVLRSNGELAFPVASPNWQRQKSLLEAEGILFNNFRVSLPLYQWNLQAGNATAG